MFRGRNDGNPVGNPRQNLSCTREICPGLRDDAAQKPVHPLSLSGGGLSWLYPNVRLIASGEGPANWRWIAARIATK